MGASAPVRGYDVRPFVDAVAGLVRSHALGVTGAYRRWVLRAAEDALNPYGCADAANLLYTIGEFPGGGLDREGWIGTLQGLQDPETGLYVERTHHPIHTTAHCTAALELFDARPAHPLSALRPHLTGPGIRAFLESLDWLADPWNASHRGSGIYAAGVLAGCVARDCEDAYFAWLAAETDCATGLLRTGCLPPAGAGGMGGHFPHLAGTFHYLFNQQYARRPHPWPAALVDTCLDVWQQRGYPLGSRIGFAEIDWIYCLNRAFRQSGHRAGDVRSALAGFAAEYLPFLLSREFDQDPACDDLHSLFGAACAVAELQAALPGAIRTDKPLRLVLDRRPFI